jgi:hypothetical protein
LLNFEILVGLDDGFFLFFCFKLRLIL